MEQKQAEEYSGSWEPPWHVYSSLLRFGHVKPSSIAYIYFPTCLCVYNKLYIYQCTTRICWKTAATMIWQWLVLQSILSSSKQTKDGTCMNFKYSYFLHQQQLLKQHSLWIAVVTSLRICVPGTMNRECARVFLPLEILYDGRQHDLVSLPLPVFPSSQHIQWGPWPPLLPTGSLPY